jgi:hypothetical protein
MLRLTGLPHVARYPKATVQRREGRFELLFHGGEYTTLRAIDFRYLGEIEDLEALELDLLARLQQLGYEVERRPAADGPEG